MEALRGIWTYRSFFNVEEGAEPTGGIQLWQAELYLDIDPATKRVFGHLGERVDPTPADDGNGNVYPFLWVEGTYSDGDPVSVSFRAVGRKGSAWESAPDLAATSELQALGAAEADDRRDRSPHGRA